MGKMIKNMYNMRWCCVYEVETGKFEEIYDEFFKIKNQDRGFYIKTGDVVVGVVNHFRGPVFFVDNRKYFLKEENYEFMHTHLQDSKGKFQLIIDGKEIESLIYNKVKIVPNPWFGDNLEKDNDFFQWLYQVEESEEEKIRFHEFYTQS